MDVGIRVDVARRFSFLATAGLLSVAVTLSWIRERPSIPAGSDAQMAAAAGYFDSTIVLARNAGPRGARGDALTVGLGYLERLRLGLGSPFRLVDEAIHDPRVDPLMGSRVSWALLSRLDRGDAYVIDPAVLDGSGPWSHDGHGATGAAHLALIERTIRNASDPRAGELAVRLAYLVAAGKGTVGGPTSGVAAEVAALIRDRELASADLRDLLADAAEQHEDVMATLVARRAARAFRVEQPPLAPLTPELRIEAMNAVGAIVAAIDTLDLVSSPPANAASEPVVAGRFAARLHAIGEQRPPLAQIIVTLRGYAKSELRATNEESLAASYSAIGDSPDSLRRSSSLALLASAVALRNFAQETPWFDGDAAPDAGDLTTEFGLASVAFARSVPSAWRPYYLRELQHGLRDMRDVFPALSLTGLNISFGTAGLADSALSMHDPQTRTVQLTINTSGGTLAHELAHDLDWQTARRLFAIAGGYSTDRAMRDRHGGGALASSVRGLAEARLQRPMGSVPSVPLPDRPAELFARGADWFTASALALRGRTNGFLSAVQDGMLPGYAAGLPTAIGAAGAASLVAAIDQMTFVPDSVRDTFQSQWADPAIIDPVLLVRRVFATPVTRVVWQAHDSPFAHLPPARPSLCAAGGTTESEARERLLTLAIDARARSIAARRARYRPASMRPDWINGVLGIPPWDTKSSDVYVGALRTAIVTELRSAPADQGVVPAVPASFRSTAASCAVIAR